MPVDAVNKHWRSRDDARRKAHSKYEEHGNQVTRSNRLKRVSKNCLCAYRPGSYTPWFERNIIQAPDIITVKKENSLDKSVHELIYQVLFLELSIRSSVFLRKIEYRYRNEVQIVSYLETFQTLFNIECMASTQLSEMDKAKAREILSSLEAAQVIRGQLQRCRPRYHRLRNIKGLSER